ncbi:MAG: alginate export family protein [Spirochaetes bacterium]|nr:alginate export family protein [Spirochaetota bacterium]MBU1082373.1 alginate export family protein [Spirochaetota bacterium]
MRPRARQTLGLAILAWAAVSGAARLGAQELFKDDGFLVPPQPKAPWLLDWGAAVSSAALYSGGGESAELAAGANGSLWLRLSLPDRWQLYARARDALVYSILPAPEAGLAFRNYWEVNAAYLQSTIPEAGLTLSVGRKPFILGSGLALSGYGDGLDAQLSVGPVSVKAFGLYTGFLAPEFSPFGMGDWDDENGARRYLGGYSIGVSIFGHELSLLGMYQGDFGLSSDGSYTSWYTGLQAKGLVAGGEYLVEWYLEDGYSPLGASSGAIAAFGGTCRYRVVIGAPTSPTLTVRYSLASGDPDRTAGTGAAGNASGSDAAFQAFGKLGAGTVLAPGFSNIHVAYAGFGFNPLEGAPLAVRNANVGLGYFYYMKYAQDGASGAAGATEASYDIGHGIDLSVRWSPFNDLSLSLDAGLFLPGAAFPAGSAMLYAVSGGLTVSL